VISSDSMSHTSVGTTPEMREGIDLREKGDGIENSEPEKGQKVSNEEIGEHPKGFRLAMVVLALVLSVFLVALDMVYLNPLQANKVQADFFETIIATAIPRITDEFHSLDQIGWYGSAFFLTLASFQSTWGKGYKYFPLKAVFVFAIGIFELGSLICGKVSFKLFH
jgi:MFS transporter, DHA2 family, glioxin efflux transporter